MGRKIEIGTETRVAGVKRLAERLGVSKSWVSLVMRGHRRPGREMARRMRRMRIEWPAPGFREGGRP